MNICRPVFFKLTVVVASVTQSRDIVCERVNPYVDYVFRVERYFYTPVERRTRYAQILKSGLDEVVEHLVLSGRRLQKFLILFDKLLYFVLIFAELEEITFLFHKLYGSAAVGTLAVYKLSFSPECFAGSAVPALVVALVDISFLVQLGKNLLYRLHMLFVGSTDKLVIRDIEKLPQLFEFSHNAVDIVLYRSICSRRNFLYLLTVLVRTRKIEYVIALHSLISRKRVADYRRIARTDMPLSAGIIDRRSNIKFLLFHIVLRLRDKFSYILYSNAQKK